MTHSDSADLSDISRRFQTQKLSDDVLLLVVGWVAKAPDLRACAMAGNRGMTALALRMLYEKPTLRTSRTLNHFLAIYESFSPDVRRLKLPVRYLDLARASTETEMTADMLGDILKLVRPTLWGLKLGRGVGGSMFDPGYIIDFADASLGRERAFNLVESARGASNCGDGGNVAVEMPVPNDRYLTSIDLGRGTHFTKPAFLRRLSLHPLMSLNLCNLHCSLFPSSFFVSDVPPTFFQQVFERLSNLESLYIFSTNALDDPFLLATSDNLPRLRSLGITYTRGFTPDAVCHFLSSKGPNLIHLQVQDVPGFWRPKALEAMKHHCRQLERLDLSANRSMGERFGTESFASVRIKPLVSWAFVAEQNTCPTTTEPIQPHVASPPLSVFAFPHLSHLILDFQTAITDSDVRALVAVLPQLNALGVAGCRLLTVKSLDAIVGSDGGSGLRYLKMLNFDSEGVQSRHLWRWAGGAGAEPSNNNGRRRSFVGSVGSIVGRNSGNQDVGLESRIHPASIADGHAAHSTTRTSPSQSSGYISSTCPSYPTPLVSLSLNFKFVSDLALFDFFHRVRRTLRAVGSLHGFRRDDPERELYKELGRIIHGIEWSSIPLVWRDWELVIDRE
ncbi:hypothetical protein HDU93_005141 [Gonapodya sp. JEL0774]|nr:hypothetical protein HDU93_005141 [Gonapodya sp. JEL0774]